MSGVQDPIDGALAAAQKAIDIAAADNGADVGCCLPRRVDAGCVMLSASSEVDAAEANVVAAAAAAVAAVRAVPALQLVVFDLTGVSFFGSCGIAMLVQAQADILLGGAAIRVVGDSNRVVRRPLEATGLLDHFTWLTADWLSGTDAFDLTLRSRRLPIHGDAIDRFGSK
ncbi:hypothetical protein GCM10009836_73040 [Pseudonocardia ailaonensis]|uniref:STAS domain-containing protein n=1 Tax=Pseudonocardia ailaonensis TaxID=367279 RepID=A0ABN2NPP0_9PSEU